MYASAPRSKLTSLATISRYARHHLKNTYFNMIPSSVRPIALALACLFPLAAFAQDDALQLRPAESMVPAPKKKSQRDAPIFFEADKMEGEANKSVTATGNAQVRQEELTIEGDSIDYTEANTTVVGRGNVSIDKAGDRAEGPFLQYNFETEEGYMETPDFSFAKKEKRLRASRGDASRLQLEGPDKDRLFDVRYTTCSVGNNDWFLRAKELELDRTTDIGNATHATIVFKDVPILYLPYIDFPLSSRRKSGFLTPSLGTTGQSGLTVEVPYYWNIAPNFDDTFTPRLLTKRGLQLNNEFRYLEQSFFGQLDAEYLRADNVTGQDRHFTRLQHKENFIPGLNLALDLQKASDDNYFRDLSTRIASTSQTYLPRDGLLTYSFADYWNASARVLRYQVLQDPLNRVTPPYSLGPRLILDGNRANFSGLNLGLHSEWTDFQHPTRINGQRTIFYPTISFPITRTYGYITPKVGYHSTYYSFGENNNAGLTNINRNLPIVSLDSSLYLDRDITFGENSYKQTLEPRLFYVKAPFRDQSRIPNFSTSELDFGFAQIFSENPFIGGDRIADANHLTMGATSRLIDPETGIERIRAALAQRYYFTTQQVTLSGSPQTDRRSDLLAGLSGQITEQWALDSALQYNADLGRTEKYAIGARYRPAPGKILNLSYRYTRESLDQVDVSAQWPIRANWQGLSRVNYSLMDNRLVEGLIGVEYNRDCWALRLVAHHFPTGEQRSTTSIFIQLELTGLSSIGINPLETLRQNIPGYTKSSEIIQ
ncbi:MAG: LPS-assembly protein LptD [Pseudomonadota bacterium]